MASMDETLRANIEEAFFDLEEFCLGDFYRAQRLHREECPRRVSEGCNNDLIFSLGPIDERIGFFGRSQAYDKGEAGIRLMKKCLEAVGIFTGGGYDFEFAERDFDVRLPGKKATIRKLKNALLLAQTYKNISQTYRTAQADLTKAFGEKRAKEMLGFMQKKAESIKPAP